MDAKLIAKTIVQQKKNPFSIKSNFAVIPNVSWGFFSWGEADLIAINSSGYLIEGEIKISKQDILKDKEKKKWNHPEWKRDIKSFYYIVPKELSDFALLNTDMAVISVDIVSGKKPIIKIERQYQKNLGRKLFLEEKLKLLRLATFRFWSTK